MGVFVQMELAPDTGCQGSSCPVEQVIEAVDADAMLPGKAAYGGILAVSRQQHFAGLPVQFGQAGIERLPTRGGRSFLGEYLGELFDEILREDQAIPTLFLPMPEDLEVGDPKGPGQKVPRGVEFPELAPEGEGGLLDQIVQILGERMEAEDVIADRPLVSQQVAEKLGRGVIAGSFGHGWGRRMLECDEAVRE